MATFGENFMDELKTRIRVSDVVGRHVKLKRQGREFAGLSPFTNEKTPSFYVNDEKGMFFCFSSGKNGDAISFLMEVEGLSFPEAVEALAGMAGMEIPKSDPRAEQRAAARKESISWMERAQEFFERTLYRADGAQARDYLKGRGLSQTAAKAFGMGFAPESFSALKDELMAQGARPEQLIEAGLLIEPEDGTRDPWDRFRNRIMIPIHDARGRLVAFGGRAMSSDQKAKYLNSPETPIFSKGRLLYNYHRARKAISDPKSSARGMIVAEGYMDVIALARAGFSHAVAPMGTALTEDQLELLWRAGPEPTLCFDGDKAGLRAAFRSIERALPLLRPGQSVRFALLPESQDPDDLIRAKGPGAMSDVLERSVSLVDMLWRREVEAEPLSTPEHKAGLKARLYKALDEITHADVKALYKTELLARFDAAYGWQAQRQRGRGKSGEAKANKATLQQGRDGLAAQTRRERSLIGAVLFYPELLEHVDERFLELEISDPGSARIQSGILSFLRLRKAVETRALHGHIEDEGLGSDFRAFTRRRGLIQAAMGGEDASLQDRLAIWSAEADALLGTQQDETENTQSRNRMAETIQNENSDAMRRLMRARKTVRP